MLYETLSKKEKIESFFSENKKVSNRLIKEELGIILESPSYKEGYNQIINLNNLIPVFDSTCNLLIAIPITTSITPINNENFSGSFINAQP